MADQNGIENSIGNEEDGLMPCLLPANILNQEEEKDEFGYQNYRQPKRHYSRSSAAAEEVEPLHNSNWRSSPPRNQRTRNGTNTKWTIGGPGMQAVFLDSKEKSCGTGVFLPRRAGAQFQSSNKPACPPVLLPYRVVQALNLNVHELGLQMKPQQERTRKPYKSSGVDCNLASSKKEKMDAISPDIFLPKEWTY